MSTQPTQRFSNRVNDYVRARPGYPAALMEFLRDSLGLRPEQVVADVGSGTGILTRMLLDKGNEVYAVEPNEPMRRAAEELLATYPKFHSISGSAEATTLDRDSVDFITAAQAFHWFDPDRAHREFKRILRPRGYVALIWNDRRADRPAFSVEYEKILNRYNTDMDRVHHRNVTNRQTTALDRLFLDAGYSTRVLDNYQDLDWEGVQSRMFSSSYMPATGDPRARQVLDELKRAFEANQNKGTVRLEYDTRVYYGRLK